jgi:peptidoglycan/xylan/chitin deacetylase (PgdA/CDA1 family)
MSTIVPRLKTALRTAIGRGVGSTGHFWRMLSGRALILMYHRVLPAQQAAAGFVQPGMYVTPDTFERHLQWLTTHFQVVPLRTLIDKWDRNDWDDRARYCAITFDDGWVDNYLHAYPLLRAHGVPATIFLPTALIGTREWLWSDRLGYLLTAAAAQGASADIDASIECAKTLPHDAREALIRRLADQTGVGVPDDRCFLDWDEVREMAGGGVDFAAHTSSHAILTTIDAEALECELRQPLDVLRREIESFTPMLAYPNGDHSAAVVDVARRAGYAAAVTTKPGLESRAPEDRLRLRRIGAHDDVTRTIPLFMFHIAQQLAAGRGVS